jgi:hypothetical protein
VTTVQGAPRDAELRAFFDVFSRASGTLDVDALARCFGEVFLAADATGAKPVTRAAFLQALPARAQAFEAAGVGPSTLDSLTYQQLDEHYLLVRTEWTAPRETGDTVRLSSSFLLHCRQDGLRIVLYLNHRGLPPSMHRSHRSGAQP